MARAVESQNRGETRDRGELQGRIEDHFRRYGAEASRIMEVFAKSHAMHPTDLQALVVIMNAERQGEPATPGDLRHALHLTSGAVTGAVDRLVQAGHVVRVPDAHDRRVVRLRRATAGQQLAQEFFAPLGVRSAAIMADFDVEQLVLVESFVAAMAQAMADHRASLEPDTSTLPRPDRTP
ncbi:MAG: MarR family winged helix-turn-helix transcriptional regulator [Propionibacteriaceae bacterium]